MYFSKQLIFLYYKFLYGDYKEERSLYRIKQLMIHGFLFYFILAHHIQNNTFFEIISNDMAKSHILRNT